MKKIRSTAIYSFTALLNRISSYYLGFAEHTETEAEHNKHLDINKSLFNAFYHGPSQCDLPFGTKEELDDLLDLFFNKAEAQGFEPKVDNINDFSECFFEKILNPDIVDSYTWDSDEEKENARSKKIMERFVLEFVLYTNIRKVDSTGFNRVSLRNAIDLSISTDFFLYTVIPSAIVLICSEDFNWENFQDSIFTEHLLPFLNSFNNLKIPNWDFYSKSMIQSMETIAMDKIRDMQKNDAEPGNPIIFVYKLNTHFYSFLNNILFHLVDYLNYEELLGTFDFSFRDKQFIEIINNDLEDNPFNGVCFYHEKDAFSIFQNNKSSDESFKPIKKIPNIQELRNMSHSYLKQLQAQLARSVEEVESKIVGLREGFINECYNEEYEALGKPELDVFYDHRQKEYKDEINFLEGWNKQTEIDKESKKKELLFHSENKTALILSIYTDLSLKIFLKRYKKKISLLQKEIEILLHPKEEKPPPIFLTFIIFIIIFALIFTLVIALIIKRKKNSTIK